MDRPTALRLLALALTLGIAADVLVPGNAPGINVPLLAVGVLAAAVLVAGRAGLARVDPWDAWLGPAAIVFAGFVAVRADPALTIVDVLLTVALGSAALVSLGGARVVRGATQAVIGLGAVVCAAAVVGAVPALRAARPFPLPARRRSGIPTRLRPVLRGLILALPLLSLFTALFAAADAIFARGLDTLLALDLRVDLSEAGDRVAVIAVAGWVAAGLMLLATGEWGVLTGEPPPAPPGRSGPSAGVPGAARSLGAASADAGATPIRLGEIEASVVLVAVDALFAVFAALQLGYLFGGNDTRAASGVTYADYARRGFFELLLVAALSGTLVAGLEATVRRRTRPYLTAALVLVALTMMTLASAFLRLRLYQDAYGWTELRFWVALSIGWVAASLLATAALVAIDRSGRLMHVLGILGLVAIGIANALGPQAYVADRNIERALDPSLVAPGGRSGLDEAYLGSLGDDAVPAVVAALPDLAPEDRALLDELLDRRAGELRDDRRLQGWPAWNLSRDRARRALADRR